MRTFVVCGTVALMLGGCDPALWSGTDFMNEVAEKGREVQEEVFQAGAKAVDNYCGVPEVIRAYARESVNAHTKLYDGEFVCTPKDQPE